MDEHDERCSHRDGTQHAATVRPPSSPRGTRFAKASPSPHTHTVCVFVFLSVCVCLCVSLWPSTPSTPAEGLELRGLITAHREETLEDIKIFQEWLQASHSTQKLSQRVHTGVFLVLFALYLYHLWHTLLFFFSSRRPGEAAAGLTGTTRQVLPTAVMTVCLFLFVSSGAYYRRLVLPGSYSRRVNETLGQLGISFCLDSGRLKMISRTS